MSKRMLIDASHREETRVVVAEGNELDEFDFVTTTKQQIKGNIYLAKVTRVEPSLQAAFVEYGGNRQGFLPFAEIHPDYYQIPVSDRQKLLEEQESEAKQAREEEEDEEEKKPRQRGRKYSKAKAGNKSAKGEPVEDTNDDSQEAEQVDTSGESTEESLNELENARASRRRFRFLKKYKIQEVIKRNQIILIQVVKEERGTKGASLTTYISLAGRYCVLMPNTAHQGGVSRKISNAEDRRNLKKLAEGLEVPKGMSIIIRTAGSKRNKTEIKRDYVYLVKLWNSIREATLQSEAPALIHEENDVIKRSIRDMHDNSIEEIIVSGEEAYKSAKQFMKLLMPSHASRVKLYKGHVPIFHEYNVETKLMSIYDPVVRMKSGATIVINPTEALVSIDVNSGRSTGERNVEETAIKTNIEAAQEIARQLRLRDLAGLVVIDFIDMLDGRNRRKVERELKDALKRDRAKIQVGRISPFGLMEMSRQRLRPSITEGFTTTCPSCQGRGIVHSTEATALQVLRELEKEAASNDPCTLQLTTTTPVLLFLINHKRDSLAQLEENYPVTIECTAEQNMEFPGFELERIRPDGGDRSDRKEDRGRKNKKDQEHRKSHQKKRRDDYQDDEKGGRRKKGNRDNKNKKDDARRGDRRRKQQRDETAQKESPPAAEEAESKKPRRSARASEAEGEKKPGAAEKDSKKAQKKEPAAETAKDQGTSSPANNNEAERPDGSGEAVAVMEKPKTEVSNTNAPTPEPEVAKQEKRPKRRGWWSRAGK